MPIINPLGIVPLIPAVQIIEPYEISVEELRFAILHLPSLASLAVPVTYEISFVTTSYADTLKDGSRIVLTTL